MADRLQGRPDSEGLAPSGNEGTVLVSSEARPPGIVVDVMTGRPVAASFYEFPPNVLDHVVHNEGFSGERDRTSCRPSSAQLRSTSHHRIFLWDADRGGFPTAETNYTASTWADATKKIEADDDKVLTLERGYSSDLGMIRIYEVDLRFQ